MGLQLATEADSFKYFPASNSSREVRDRMLAACQRLGVRVQCKAPVTGVSRDAEAAGWRLRLEDGSEHCSASIASPCSHFHCKAPLKPTMMSSSKALYVMHTCQVHAC